MQSKKHMLALITLTVSTLLSCPADIYAKGNSILETKHHAEQHETANRLVSLENKFDQFERRLELLEMEEVIHGPITVSHIHLGRHKHFTVAQPGEIVDCSFRYKLDSKQQDFLSKNHLIVGLKDVAAETCVTHLYGVWDSTGKADFTLQAPLAEGDYEVRIAYRPGDKCEDAINSWNVLKDEPDQFATIGILRVRAPK